MKPQVPFIVLVLLLSVTVLLSSCARIPGPEVQHARTIGASEVPPAILTAFHNMFPGSTVLWVGAFGSGTNVAYSVEFTQAGKLLAVGVDALGDIGSAYEPRAPNPNR